MICLRGWFALDAGSWSPLDEISPLQSKPVAEFSRDTEGDKGCLLRRGLFLVAHLQPSLTRDAELVKGQRCPLICVTLAVPGTWLDINL